MSVYLVKTKGWRYDFTLKGTRHTEAWYKTKTEAKAAEARRREGLINPKQNMLTEKAEEVAQTDMAFSEIVKLRLQNLADYNALGDDGKHYKDCIYVANRWLDQPWGYMECSKITKDMIFQFLKYRKKSCSIESANKDLKLLMATFNFGISEEIINVNPAAGIKKFPKNKKKKKKYVPPEKDVKAVLKAALEESQDSFDFIVSHVETLGRNSEINRLKWNDIDFEIRMITLYTRKKNGGSLTPRDIDMTDMLYEVLRRRYQSRDRSKEWVFWHRYYSSKLKSMVDGPFGHRKKMMKRLCEAAGVDHFGFHGFRHYGASLMANENIPITVIQEILGHESRKTTEIYLKSLKGTRHKAMKILESVRRISVCDFSHTESHTE